MSQSLPRARPVSTALFPYCEAGLVGAGGAIGAVLRAAVAAWVPAAGAPGLVATQLVNLTGTFALGVLVAWLEQSGPRPYWRAFLAVGALGSFTTFSTLIDERRAVAAATSASVALLFLAGSLVLGIASFRAGQLVAEHSFCAGPNRDGRRDAKRDAVDAS
jgi:CrcB protein